MFIYIQRIYRYMYIDVPTDDISIETLIIFYFTMHYVDMPIYILREIE